MSFDQCVSGLSKIPDTFSSFYSQIFCFIAQLTHQLLSPISCTCLRELFVVLFQRRTATNLNIVPVWLEKQTFSVTLSVRETITESYSPQTLEIRGGHVSASHRRVDFGSTSSIPLDSSQSEFLFSSQMYRQSAHCQQRRNSMPRHQVGVLDQLQSSVKIFWICVLHCRCANAPLLPVESVSGRLVGRLAIGPANVWSTIHMAHLFVLDYLALLTLFIT